MEARFDPVSYAAYEPHGFDPVKLARKAYDLEIRGRVSVGKMYKVWLDKPRTSYFEGEIVKVEFSKFVWAGRSLKAIWSVMLKNGDNEKMVSVASLPR